MNLDLRATPEEVMRGVEALQQFAAAQQIPDGTIFDLALALEECASNVVHHAFKRDGQRTFRIAAQKRGGLRLTRRWFSYKPRWNSE